MADDESVQTFYFDQNKAPICPQYLEEETAMCEGCQYSHSDAAYYNYIEVPPQLLENRDELYTYLISYVSLNPETFIEIQSETADKQFQKDIDELNYLVGEMRNFEVERTDLKCPILADIGNCWLGKSCEYAHESKENEWYPESRNCECCRGHKYGCKDNACRRVGVCQVCKA